MIYNTLFDPTLTPILIDDGKEGESPLNCIHRLTKRRQYKNKCRWKITIVFIVYAKDKFCCAE